MISLLSIPLLIVQLWLLVQAAYLAFLTLVGLLYRAPHSNRSANNLRFAVLVPAHNEETLLPRMIHSVLAGSYPREYFQIFVVADNCSDRTAEVARAFGATAYERSDLATRGKGYALQWLLEQIGYKQANYDAYLFLDADCEIAPDFLSEIAGRIAIGHRAVQAYYTGSEGQKSFVATLRFAALVLKHHTRSRGRAVLGLPCGLFGTGMAFAREVIQSHGWGAFTIAEDIEYEIKLAEDDIYVTFAPEAKVFSEMPRTFEQARSQNLRWERGRVRLAVREGPRILRQAWRDRSLKKADVLLEQAIPPLSVLVFLNAVILIVVLFAANTWLLYLSLLTFVMLGIHVLCGLFVARVPAQTYVAFLFAPVFVAWKLFIYAGSLLPGATAWVRTQRSGEEP